MDFVIVRFIDEDEAPGIVSSNWISADKNSCKFPNVKTEEKKQKLLLAKAAPEEDWLDCRIRVLKKFSNYQSARLHLSEAEDTSNLESCDELDKPRRRKRKIVRLPGEESSDENEVQLPQPSKVTLTLPKKFSHPYPEPPLNTSTSTVDYSRSISQMDSELVHKVNTVPNPTPSNSSCSTFSPRLSTVSLLTRSLCNSPELSRINCNTRPPSRSSDVDSVISDGSYSSDLNKLKTNQTLMWNVLEEFSATAKRLEAKMDSLIALVPNNLQAQAADGQLDEYNNGMNFLSALPVGTDDDFLILNTKIAESSTFKQNLTRILMVAGARDVKGFVINIMRKLIDDNVAETYSLTGKSVKNGTIKNAFAKTETYKLIIDICSRSYKDVKETTIREVVSDWLLQAKYRKSRRVIRQQNRNIN